MKLCNRDVFQWRETRWRLIALDKPNDVAWIIDISAKTAWPIRVSPSELEGCEREAVTESLDTRMASKACGKKLEDDFARTKKLLESGADLFDSDERRAAIERIAELTERCPRTLEALLRRWWQRGMTKSALIPDFANCGRHEGGATAGRGRCARSGRNNYQITAEDYIKLDAAINYYFADERRSIGLAYQWLGATFYSIEDGNGTKYLPEFGERPSQRQFKYYLHNKHSHRVQIEKRKGKKEYARDHKPTLSDTIADCIGIGHRYENDASIADVDIVHDLDRKTIIGKATIYFIVDRRSRLIPSFYVGLDNPCWEVAVEAMVSLVESKRELCERYGVKYDPLDWPAEGFLPQEFIGDHAEMFSKFSNSIADELGIAIANPPSLMPNLKPNVETRFKLITVDLRKITPGYQPPEYFGKRRKKRYDKEACLTLKELIREILEAVIKHNRTPLTTDVRSAAQIMQHVEPSPIGLWNAGVTETGYCGNRYDAQTVRMALLPRATAKITKDGLNFKGLYYASDHPDLIRAFVRARKGRDEITVSYDRRYVDCIYVHLKSGPVLATLSEKNHGYRGLSFRQIEIVSETAQEQQEAHQQTREEVAFESNQRRAPAIREAEAKRDELGPLSIDARMANGKAARAEQKRRENVVRAEQQVALANNASSAPTQETSNVMGLPVRNRTTQPEAAALTAAQRARKRMS